MKTSVKYLKKTEAIFFIFCLIFIALGIMTRIAVYLYNRSLFLDEAMLASSVVQLGYLGLFQPLDCKTSGMSIFSQRQCHLPLLKKDMTSSEKRESMYELVRQWKSRGLSQEKYAAQNSLTLVKFRYWIKKLNEPTDNEPVFAVLQ